MWVLGAVAVVALLIAFSARKQAGALRDQFERSRFEGASQEASFEELKQELTNLRKLLALMAAGHPVDAHMVKEGRLFRNASADDLKAELENGGKVCVIDVRTGQEWAGGHIPGAVHLPVEQLEQRLSEVRRDGVPMYLVCAQGVRSAAAAEFLANRGYLNVHNVEGGMSGWRGELLRD